jgi:hypothetical protein
MATFTSVGETGEYSIAKDGYHPSLGDAFHYKDQNYEFWFYVRVKPGSDGRGEMSVWQASARRMAGADPSISASHVRIVEENIRRYFEAFDLFSRPISPTNPAGPIKFDWRLRQ